MKRDVLSSGLSVLTTIWKWESSATGKCPSSSARRASSSLTFTAHYGSQVLPLARLCGVGVAWTDNLDFVSVRIIDVEGAHALQDRVHAVAHVHSQLDEPVLEGVVLVA